MKRWRSAELLEALQADVRSLIVQGTRLLQQPVADLLQQPEEGAWSVAQVVEHLNTYSRYYHTQVRKSLQKPAPAKESFQPGWLGDYFTRIMSPQPDGTIRKKMKAPKNSRPAPALDAQRVIRDFLHYQQELLDLLEQAKMKDIGHLRVPISIAPFIRLKLGDTFRFLIAHEQRHFLQVQRTLHTVTAPAVAIA